MADEADELFSEMDEFDDANWDAPLSEDDSADFVLPLPNDEMADYEELED